MELIQDDSIINSHVTYRFMPINWRQTYCVEDEKKTKSIYDPYTANKVHSHAQRAAPVARGSIDCELIDFRRTLLNVVLSAALYF